MQKMPNLKPYDNKSQFVGIFLYSLKSWSLLFKFKFISLLLYKFKILLYLMIKSKENIKKENKRWSEIIKT